MSESSHKFITAVHKTSAKGWAEERGFLYLRAENGGQLAEAMKSFTSPEAAERPVLLEVFTDKDEDTRMLKNYYHQLNRIQIMQTKENGQPSGNMKIFF